MPICFFLGFQHLNEMSLLLCLLNKSIIYLIKQNLTDLKTLKGSVYLIETWFVCFSSDEGWLHRAVKIRDRVHIIEELQLFEEKQPINNMVISQKQVARYTPSNC